VYRAAVLLDARSDDVALAELDAAAEQLAHAPAVHGYALGLRARALLAAADTEGALRCATDAMAILRETGLQEGEADVRLAYVLALRAAGHLADAAAACATALARIDAAAVSFTDPAAHARFLAVPVHVALRALA
jgi:hypothetical protein